MKPLSLIDGLRVSVAMALIGSYAYGAPEPFVPGLGPYVRVITTTSPSAHR